MQRKFIFNGGASKRYHTVDTLKTQDIAAHSFGVAWLCELFTGGKASKNLIMAALAHDLAEHVVGDVPSPSKRALKIGELFDGFENKLLSENGVSAYGEALNPEEALILKLSDMTEGMLFCLRERTLGNRSVEVVYGRFRTYAQEALERYPAPEHAATIMTILDEIHNEWKEITNDTSKRAPSGGNTL